jgi:hypothetical protein
VTLPEASHFHHFPTSINSFQNLIFLPPLFRAGCFGGPRAGQAVQRIPYNGFDLWGEIDPKDSPPETLG